MAEAIEEMKRDIQDIKVELRRISHILDEDFELSDSAKKELAEARKEPLSKYISHEKVLKEFS